MRPSLIAGVAAAALLSGSAAADSPNATYRLSVRSGGAQATQQCSNYDGSHNVSLSADGRLVIFDSDATDLVPNDVNCAPDVFLHDRKLNTTRRISFGPNGEESPQASYFGTISANGRFVAFTSAADWYGDGIIRDNVFVRDLVTNSLELVSVDSAGNRDAKGSRSVDPHLSADGRFVAFVSESDTLVPDDTNNTADVFVHDRKTGVTERVNVGSDGTQATFGGSFEPTISADGRFVAFGSQAQGLVPGVDVSNGGIFVRDRESGTTVLLSADANGVSEFVTAASISANGQFVAFASADPDLVPGDSNNVSDIFVANRLTGAIERVSVNSAGVQGNDFSFGESFTNPWPRTGLAISPDGRYVVFASVATNLVANDTNGQPDVFLHDRTKRVTEMISNNGPRSLGDYQSLVPAAISETGRYVAYESYASNLVKKDTNGFKDVFLRDRMPN